MPGPGRQWAEDREANVGVPKIRFSARGSLDFIECMKPFWIKSQSIATWKWLSPISPQNMFSWPSTWSKVLQKRCRKNTGKVWFPKNGQLFRLSNIAWHCDTYVTYSQAQKKWQGWNSQLWPQWAFFGWELGPKSDKPSSDPPFGVDLGWTLKPRKPSGAVSFRRFFRSPWMDHSFGDPKKTYPKIWKISRFMSVWTFQT